MGVLVTSAVPRLRCPEEANLRAPESVVTLHTSFIRAGADLIETNTFGANRRKLSQLYLEDEFERINSAGVKLAREAREIAGRDVFVAGSIGPLGDLAVPAALRSELFAEQAALLDGRGIDLFMVETFYDLDELEAAIEAVRGVSSLPIVATLTFDEGAETLAGVTASAAAERLRPLELAAIGANHGAGLHAALAALEAMAGDGGPPLAALPERRPREPQRRPRHLPARDAGVLRRVRGPRAPARRPPDRRLLRDDAARDRRDRLGGRGGAQAHRAPGRDRARARRAAPRPRRVRDRAGAQAARARVGRPASSSTRRRAVPTTRCSRWHAS